MFIGKGKVIKIGNKKMGVVCRDKVFRTFRKEKHKFRIYNGWGFNKELFKELRDIGIKFIEIHTEKRILKTQLGTILQKGINYKNPKKEKDYQFIVPETYFEIRAKENLDSKHTKQPVWFSAKEVKLW